MEYTIQDIKEALLNRYSQQYDNSQEDFLDRLLPLFECGNIKHLYDAKYREQYLQVAPVILNGLVQFAKTGGAILSVNRKSRDESLVLRTESDGRQLIHHNLMSGFLNKKNGFSVKEEGLYVPILLNTVLWYLNDKYGTTASEKFYYENGYIHKKYKKGFETLFEWGGEFLHEQSPEALEKIITDLI